jgi:hypothetical protein
MLTGRPHGVQLLFTHHSLIIVLLLNIYYNNQCVRQCTKLNALHISPFFLCAQPMGEGISFRCHVICSSVRAISPPQAVRHSSSVLKLTPTSLLTEMSIHPHFDFECDTCSDDDTFPPATASPQDVSAFVISQNSTVCYYCCLTAWF